MQEHRWFWRCANLGAFMVPGLALWLPSGYSHGAVLLLLGALFSARTWWGRAAPRSARWLAFAFAGMAALWLLDLGGHKGLGSLDRPSKYLLALPCLFFLMAFPPRASWLWRGIAVGALGSGLIGLYQTWFQQLPRATGFTNAIQYGDLSLLLASMSGLLLLVRWRQWPAWQRGVLGLATLLGAMGSVLSQARGGWLALVPMLWVSAWLLTRHARRRHACWGLGALLVAAAALSQLPAVEHRVEQATQEIQDYQQHGDGSSSVGHRLAHWQLAWAMGKDRPWTGWGQAGYEAEKARRVAAGQAHPAVLAYGHAHQEVLDMFAKRGVLGILLLLVFYGVPLAIFWPTDARIRDEQTGLVDPDLLALHLVGLLLPLSYIGFGLTQVFLAHNSGNLFYLFMCPLVLATLEHQRAHRGNGPPA